MDEQSDDLLSEVKECIMLMFSAEASVLEVRIYRHVLTWPNFVHRAGLDHITRALRALQAEGMLTIALHGASTYYERAGFSNCMEDPAS